ncbi:unnamed protein product [Citrullus colocynthis]|uniref:Uncharacterized protein n=1 Tax=Citrullus colocynthis TaxID=252529 RepID=A0ABP0YML9_9ROSI
MGIRKNDEEASVAVHSSIALLQERFRQLQKMKEMREEREFVKLLSLSQSPKTHSCCSFFFNNTNTCVLFEPSISHPHHELMMMKKKKKEVEPTILTLLPQTSLSLSLTSSNDQPNNNIPTLMDLWPLPHTTTTSPTTSCDSAISFITKLNDHEYSDSDTGVDTSLHL